MKQVLPIRAFYGGFSDGDRTGPLGSFKNAKRIDIYSKPDSIKILPAPSKVSGSTVTDLIKWMIVVGTNVYHYGDTGRFYKCTNAGASWSLIGTLTSASGNGMGYFKTDDYIYLAKDALIARYGPISGSPSLTQDFFTGDTRIVNPDGNTPADRDQQNSVSGQTYTLPTSIDEGDTHRQTFVPSYDPQRSIEINVDTVGTGDWTLTVHDADNASIATATITNGNMSTGDVKFSFSSDWRPIIGATYHFHVTSTVADGKVVTGTADDLEDVDFTSYYGILVSDSDYHPVSIIGSIMAFGNGPYVATFDGVTYSPNALALPTGLKVRSIVRGKEFLEIGTWSGDSITDNDEGFKFYWDGVSSQFNFFSEIGYGGVNAQAVMGGKTYMIAGSTSVLYESRGVEDPEPKKTIPGVGAGKYIEVLPGAMDVWDGLLHIGIAGGGDSTTVLRGVWQYGVKREGYPYALNYGYTISNNSDEQSTDVVIGAIKGVGRRLFIGWKDGSDYGVDMVATTDNPAATGEYEALIFDDNRPFKKKKAVQLIANHVSLAGSAEGVALKYKLDRASSFTSGSTNTTSGDVVTELPIALVDIWHEVEIGVTLHSSGAVSPEVTSLGFEYDDLIEEGKVGK